MIRCDHCNRPIRSLARAIHVTDSTLRADFWWCLRHSHEAAQFLRKLPLLRTLTGFRF